MNGLSLHGQESSSDDEDAKNQPTLAERQAQAAKDREEKQRKYEERRQELFGSAGTMVSNGKSGSGKSSPGNLTPPTSRSATPNRGRGNGRGRGGRGGNTQQHAQPRPQSQGGLFEPSMLRRQTPPILRDARMAHRSLGNGRSDQNAHRRVQMVLAEEVLALPTEEGQPQRQQMNERFWRPLDVRQLHSLRQHHHQRARSKQH